MLKPYIVTVSSEKGGVGKTTLATNLAIYLKALCEDLPVTLFSFDNHFSVDRMFRIGRGAPNCDLTDMLKGIPLDQVLQVGEYGVQYIPSSRHLDSVAEGLAKVDALASILAASSLEGIVIIDTRPTLDAFTRNALFASDRVIIPVKDAPSLENCRNLYAFFDAWGLSKRPLRVLPCLIDSRIRYEGPFKNAQQLLRGYAINRGYRCLEGFIAKSPKVESLNTNPEGKIYPILTYGRGTTVHSQFAHLARQVFIGLRESTERRLEEISSSQQHDLELRQAARRQRHAELIRDCLICGQSLADEDPFPLPGFFCQTSDGTVAGFLEEECFAALVFRYFYQAQKEIPAGDPLRELFRESARRSYFVLRGHTAVAGTPQLEFFRFDEEGFEISRKTLDLKEFESRFLSREKSRLYELAARTLFTSDGLACDRFLLVRRISETDQDILAEEPYRRFAAMMQAIARKLPLEQAQQD